MSKANHIDRQHCEDTSEHYANNHPHVSFARYIFKERHVHEFPVGVTMEPDITGCRL